MSCDQPCSLCSKSDECFGVDEAPDLGLCGGCIRLDDDKCTIYKMPLYMVKRKEKCKHYKQWSWDG